MSDEDLVRIFKSEDATDEFEVFSCEKYDPGELLFSIEFFGEYACSLLNKNDVSRLIDVLIKFQNEDKL